MRWLKRLGVVALYLVVVGAVAAAAYWLPGGMRNGLESYQAPNLEVPEVRALVASPNPDPSLSNLPGATKPESGRVVLVVVSGLGRDDLDGLPVLRNLVNPADGQKIATGANLFTAAVPANTPAMMTLLTGAGVELTGGYTLDTSSPSANNSNLAYQMSRFDNLFLASHRKGNTTSFFGTPEWQSNFAPDWTDYNAAFPAEQSSQDVVDAALNFLKKRSSNFTLIQLAEMGRAQTLGGYNSPEVLTARANINNALTRLSSDDQIDLNRTTVIITGDWDNSLRARDKWVVPLVMLGQAVQPGERSWGRQEDVAPTIAALLGIQIPRHNQGRIMTSALSIPSQDMAEKLLALTEQQQALALAYRAALGLPPPIAVNDLKALNAEKSIQLAVEKYQRGLYDNAEQVLDPVLRYNRQDVITAREEWFNTAQIQRAILAVVILAIPLGLLFFWRSGLALLTFAGAAVAAGLPYLLYNLQGRSWSFNIVRPEALREASIFRAGLGLLLGLVIVAIGFDWAERRRQRRSGRVDLHYTVITSLRRQPFPFNRLVIACLYLSGWLIYFGGLTFFLYYFWRYGYFGPFVPNSPIMPVDFGASFGQVLALNHLYGALILMLAAPVVLIILVLLKRRFIGKDDDDKEEDVLAKSRRAALTATKTTDIIKA